MLLLFTSINIWRFAVYMALHVCILTYLKSVPLFWTILYISIGAIVRSYWHLYFQHMLHMLFHRVTILRMFFESLFFSCYTYWCCSNTDVSNVPAKWWPHGRGVGGILQHKEGGKEESDDRYIGSPGARSNISIYCTMLFGMLLDPFNWCSLTV